MDSYGACGQKTCPNARAGHDFCFDDLSANHSFYLAFENSNCQDYITEKFWRTLTKPVIPVVMGGKIFTLLVHTGFYDNQKKIPAPNLAFQAFERFIGI